MSRSFGTNSGSFESLKRRTRCGAKPCARQMRWTEETLTPTALARGSGPMRRLVRRLGRGQRHHLVDDLLAERRNARRPGLVAQQAVDPFRGEAFLPAPDASLRLARPAHDLNGAKTVRRQQHDLGPPGMLLRDVAVTDNRAQAAATDGGEGDGDTRAHAPESHGSNRSGIPSWIQSSDLIH